MKLGLLAVSAFTLSTLAFAPAQAQVAAAAAAGAAAAAPHLVAATPAILTGAVSSASAHAGTAVLAKLASGSALSNGLKLPAGSQLLGHVTDVKSLASAGGGGKGVSQLRMLFDRVKLPSGNSMPIAPSEISSLGSNRQHRENGQQAEAQADAQAQTQTSAGSQAQSTGSGGLLGGVVSGVGNTVGGVVNGVGGLVKGTVTGLSGVLLQPNGTLAAQGHDVNVPANTQISISASANASAQ